MQAAPAQCLQAPISVYEVHLGSWMRVPREGNRSLSYREAAPKLIEYVQRLGFTHVEFLPLMDHPFFSVPGAIKRQTYFAPPATTARRKTSCTSSTSSTSLILSSWDWVPSTSDR